VFITVTLFWFLLSIAAGGAGLPRGTAAAGPLALIFNGFGFGFFPTL
jgi:hypothetical protein